MRYLTASAVVRVEVVKADDGRHVGDERVGLTADGVQLALTCPFPQHTKI